MTTKVNVDLSVIGLLGDKLYNQPRPVIFMREVLQNSLDAGAHVIRFEVSYDNRVLSVICYDDGCGIEDFDKYFLTIGGSTKRENPSQNVGGFGIAKLAIMAADDWSIESIGGYLDKQILQAGGDILQTSPHYKGTKVIGRFQHESSTMIKQIQDVLEVCSWRENCDIQYNGMSIPSASPESMRVNGDDSITVITSPESNLARCFVVRLNGLFMFRDWIYLDSEEYKQYVYLFDINTSLSAYDDNYPLNANREDINDSDIKSSYQYIRGIISRLDADRQHILELKKYQVNGERDNYLVCGTFDTSALKYHSFLIKTWDRYIEQLHTLLSIKEDYKVGLSNNEDSQAVRCSFSGQPIYYLVNPDSMTDKHDKGKILSLAIHEITHYFEDSHYDSFVVKENEITASVFNALSMKEFRW